MGSFLLDVNVLVALIWPEHVAHDRVLRWFGANAKRGWATCPLTESAFVRILSNPAFSPNALTPRAAMGVLNENLQHPAHHFWADDLPFLESAKTFEERIVGHRQITDAYLLGLAGHHKAKLATLDSGIANLLKNAPAFIELIR